MRTRYPDEMTIILQHQFWDLSVTDHAFEVGLSFGGVPERLLVPFDALTAFSDPAAEFGLKFEPRYDPADEKHAGTVTKLPAGAGPKLVHEDEPAPVAEVAPKAKPAAKLKHEDKTPAAPLPATGADASHIQEPSAAPAEKGAKDDKIVSIDAFRKNRLRPGKANG